MTIIDGDERKIHDNRNEKMKVKDLIELLEKMGPEKDIKGLPVINEYDTCIAFDINPDMNFGSF